MKANDPNAGIAAAIRRVRRIPSPKGKDGRVYDLIHRAWRAGVIADFRYHEGGAFTIDGARFASRENAETFIGAALRQAGVLAVEWSEPWCGRRDVVVTPIAGQVAA